MKNRVLHVMIADVKFNLPLANYLINDLKLPNHRFLILNNQPVSQIVDSSNVVLLIFPFRKNLLINFYRFCKEVVLADKIIAHALPFSLLFVLFPWKLKRVIWPINGGIDIPKGKGTPKSINDLISEAVKKRVGFHASHIEEDSIYTNQMLHSKAEFMFSPVYLSNVANSLKEKNRFIYTKTFVHGRIMLGNSNSPTNNHIDSIELINSANLQPQFVYSILSYGMYVEYSFQVIEKAMSVFGSKFKPILNFLELDEYLALIENIDFAVFNHKRQEAMGVTIQLLSLGKPVFFNPESPGFKSLKRRGYIVFDINELQDMKNMKYLDLSKNRELLLSEYSIENLNNFYRNL
jgi:dTDP-N-acetylfucosamine:lipid II N-acetylfucosaminyltransferase